MSKGDAEREKRLAEALRANLRRRKEQARGGLSAQQTERGGHSKDHADNPEDGE